MRWEAQTLNGWGRWYIDLCIIRRFISGARFKLCDFLNLCQGRAHLNIGLDGFPVAARAVR